MSNILLKILEKFKTLSCKCMDPVDPETPKPQAPANSKPREAVPKPSDRLNAVEIGEVNTPLTTPSIQKDSDPTPEEQGRCFVAIFLPFLIVFLILYFTSIGDFQEFLEPCSGTVPRRELEVLLDRFDGLNQVSYFMK